MVGKFLNPSLNASTLSGNGSDRGPSTTLEIGSNSEGKAGESNEGKLGESNKGQRRFGFKNLSVHGIGEHIVSKHNSEGKETGQSNPSSHSDIFVFHWKRVLKKKRLCLPL